MKKIGNVVLIGVLTLPGLFFPNIAQGKSDSDKTLAEIRKELEDLEHKKDENKEQQQLTQEEINRIAASITKNTNDINQLSDELIKLQEEIVKAEKDIEEKDKEIKEIINFLQVSSGESAYLEYAFGAKDFTDFIYRMAISEQLSSYNDELVAQFNQLIESNKKRKEETNQKQEALRKKQEELVISKSKLGVELKTISDVGAAIEDDIKDQLKFIDSLEKMGCREDETLNQCTTRTQILPPNTAFYRPIVSGRVSSEFGSRCYWIGKEYRCDLHGGIDMTQSGNAVPVYASASGMVTKVWSRTPCGGNQVYVVHNINGKHYTTGYAHLRTINVAVGQMVTTDTVIGTMGGDPRREYWDGCSTGQHVHFMIATGHYGKMLDYDNWNVLETHMINPRTILNVPAIGRTFTSRTTKY